MESLFPFSIDESAREYLYRVLELGVVEGPVGGMQVTAEIREIVNAIHHVMAGGKASVQVVTSGVDCTVEELDRRLNEATKHAPHHHTGR